MTIACAFASWNCRCLGKTGHKRSWSGIFPTVSIFFTGNLNDVGFPQNHSLLTTHFPVKFRSNQIVERKEKGDTLFACATEAKASCLSCSSSNSSSSSSTLIWNSHGRVGRNICLLRHYEATLGNEQISQLTNQSIVTFSRNEWNRPPPDSALCWKFREEMFVQVLRHHAPWWFLVVAAALHPQW